MTNTQIVLIVLAVIVFFVIVSSFKIVPDFQRMVIFRLGRCIGAKGPGLVLLIPAIDKGVRVDLRETVFEVPPQTCITEDNATVSIDFLIYMKVTDAVPSVVEVVDFNTASRGIAITTLRAIVGDMMLDDVLAKRDHINESLRHKLDEATTRWGIKVTSVEIKEIIPPRDILEAMGRQMSAERTRRAVVLEADGQREAAIKMADGRKTAAILEAEGKQQATVLAAEAQRDAALLQAEGYSQALGRVYEVARHIDGRTMNLQYLETLKQLGNSPSAKWIVPIELMNLVQPFTQIGQRANNGMQQPMPPMPNGNPPMMMPQGQPGNPQLPPNLPPAHQ